MHVFCQLKILISIKYVIVGCRKKVEPKPMAPEFSAFAPQRTPDVQLATLRELPRNTTQTTNALYAIK